METQIAPGKRAVDEKAWAQTQLNLLGSLKVKLPADYSLPESERPRKAPLVQVPVVAPPPVQDTNASNGPQTIQIDIKCSKPALSYTLECPLTSSIAALKALLLQEQGSRAPPVDDQRWLFKGKVLNDAKLLKEYDMASGDKITLMLKAGSSFDPNKAVTAPGTSDATAAAAPYTPPALSASQTSRHSRVPSLTLNSSNLDPADDQSPASAYPAGSSASFTSKITEVRFWRETLDRLQAEFGASEASKVFESWFGASKQWLLPGDVARIRDELQMHGMGGI